jgi:antibiotic biosynthesis monooxygenase (ABM) superfamily enzyme
MKNDKKTSRHKLALLSWLVIYPLITGIFLLFNQPLMQLALPLRTLILTIVLVGLMSYIIMPWLTKKLNKWLTD